MVSYQTLGCFALAYLLSICLPASDAQLDNTVQPKVTIPQGTLVGTTLTTRHGRNISAFLRIPYGQPPIRNLRFANPLPAKKWDGILDASIESNMCVQPSSGGIMAGAEDCLYVKVYTPQLPENQNSPLLPVMVYIHGGAFAADDPPHNGPEYLLDANVVLVTINYRLGALGFLSTGDEFASGNWGLKDQRLGLRWVQDNIEYFGGDPDHVTLFGESAGAICVHLLTLSNSTIGLFHKYITQSGSALAPWGYRPKAAYSVPAFEFGESVGCPYNTSESLINCLRTNDSLNVSLNSISSTRIVIWGPTDEPDIEGAILTDSPSNLLAAGKIRDLPWVSGTVRDEGLLFTNRFYVNEEAVYNLLRNFDVAFPALMEWTDQPDAGAAWTSAAKYYFFDNDLTTNTSEILANLTMLMGDYSFHYPARKFLKQHHALATNPQYFYTFNYRGTWSFSYEATGTLENYGVKHADDLIYLFRKDLLFSHFEVPMSERDYEMVDTMVQLWTSFAINGTPTASALGDGITWEPYSAEDKYLRIGNGSDVALEVQSSYFPERMEFWSSLETLVATQPEVSSSATSTANFLLLLLATCSKFFLSAIVGKMG